MDGRIKVYKWLNNVQILLYPRLCVLCGGRGVAGLDLCQGCLQELPRIVNGCLRCAMPLQSPGQLCGECLRRPPPFARSRVPFRYEPPLDHLLQQLKFHRKLHLAPLLATFIAEQVKREQTALPQLLLPVPLSRQRTRERGYNQALELARELSRELAIPLDGKSLQRHRHTAAQTSLGAVERRRNLRGAFRVVAPLPKHVAIIDDVVTTGATVEALARECIAKGAETIEVWACARAGKTR